MLLLHPLFLLIIHQITKVHMAGDRSVQWVLSWLPFRLAMARRVLRYLVHSSHRSDDSAEDNKSSHRLWRIVAYGRVVLSLRATVLVPKNEQKKSMPWIHLPQYCAMNMSIDVLCIEGTIIITWLVQEKSTLLFCQTDKLLIRVPNTDFPPIYRPK